MLTFIQPHMDNAIELLLYFHKIRRDNQYDRPLHGVSILFPIDQNKLCYTCFIIFLGLKSLKKDSCGISPHHCQHKILLCYTVIKKSYFCRFNFVINYFAELASQCFYCTIEIPGYLKY